MDTVQDAREYDAMDHSAVNAQFVTDLFAAVTDWSLKRPVHGDTCAGDILDLGTGTAQIPIELARRALNAHVMAIDAAESMLAVARTNISAFNLDDRIHLVLADARQLPFEISSFSVVISNSIVHHIAEPRAVVTEAIRVCARGGLMFHRDLMRPEDDAQLERLVETYAGSATAYQRKLFSDSFRAALTVDEVRDLVSSLGYSPDTARPTSDRHWTWVATRE
ncbi:MAG TPA: class I SAM-dependent methyltransferase [Lacipirellulaceae bacterium]|nr:class I SAM-dependent methyltransferase [Lacipirellulaceae bacterium]